MGLFVLARSLLAHAVLCCPIWIYVSFVRRNCSGTRGCWRILISILISIDGLAAAIRATSRPGQDEIKSEIKSEIERLPVPEQLPCGKHRR